MSSNDDISVKDMMVSLHLVSLCGGTLHGKTRLQKLIFLSQEKSNQQFDFDFLPAQFGPLSYKLNHTLERMKKLGLLKETSEQTISGNKVINYSLTEDGNELVKVGLNQFLTPQIIQANKEIVSKYGNMPYVELLDYVHTEYPQYLAK